MAEQNPDVNFIGMGAQDSFGFAEEFVETTGVNTDAVTMIWDESFETWSHYDVRGQPTLMVIDGDGNFVDGWTGFVPEDELLAIIG